MSYTLHFAPDNASMVIRLALEHLSLPHETRLVDRTATQQRSAAYLAINPNGLIPALETPDGVMFETTAILLYLSERHTGLMPEQSSERAMALKWLVWLGNTLHPALRMMFYPEIYTNGDVEAVRVSARTRITQMLEVLAAARDAPWLDGRVCATGFYLAALLRWLQIYGGPLWFDLGAHPKLAEFATRIETCAAAQRVIHAEGLGPHPFSKAQRPTPPKGNAT
jgi:glutathione S-transferase